MNVDLKPAKLLKKYSGRLNLLTSGKCPKTYWTCSRWFSEMSSKKLCLICSWEWERPFNLKGFLCISILLFHPVRFPSFSQTQLFLPSLPPFHGAVPVRSLLSFPAESSLPQLKVLAVSREIVPAEMLCQQSLSLLLEPWKSWKDTWKRWNLTQKFLYRFIFL